MVVVDEILISFHGIVAILTVSLFITAFLLAGLYSANFIECSR